MNWRIAFKTINCNRLAVHVQNTEGTETVNPIFSYFTKKSSNSTWRRDDLVYQTVDYVCKYGGFYESKGKRKGRL